MPPCLQLQQGFAKNEMGLRAIGARRANVSYGSWLCKNTIAAETRCPHHVRFLPDNDQIADITLRRRRPKAAVSSKIQYRAASLSLTDDGAYCATPANACRPRSVMIYNERCSLCGSSVTYCSNTKRASAARDSDELTVRPRSPAAHNAFRNQISSLVNLKSTLRDTL